MPDIRSDLERALHALTTEHLAKLAEYVPGPVKKRGTRRKLLSSYRQDPVFSIFGLDSVEYLGATLAGGTVTSIHRKIGDIYEACVKTIFMQALSLSTTDVTYTTVIQSGDAPIARTADVYVQFDKLEETARQRISSYCQSEVARLTAHPRIDLAGVGMEIRHCYQTGDSKRTQADEAMARHPLLSGILPIMPLFCNQSNPGIVSRYQSVWVIKQRADAYHLVHVLTGFDFFGFLKRNRDDFRRPIIELLRRLAN